MSTCILEITLGSDERTTRTMALRGRSWLLGRGPGVDIELDHETVSRHHAELRRCPFGRWWIHDRSSTNGTYVNGCAVDSRIVAPGDDIVIGSFSLKLHASEAGKSEFPPPRRPHVAPQAPLPAPTRPGGELTPEEIRAVLAHGRHLARYAERSERRRALCEWTVRELGALDAVVVRVGDGGALRVLEGHLGSGRARDPLSRGLLGELWQHRALIARRCGSETGDRCAEPCAVLVQPLLERQDHLDALYLELPSEEALTRWQTLAPLVAGAYEHAELVWRVRRQVRATAFVEHELETARMLQRRLIPTDLRFDGLEVITGYEPCLWVGGDYVDALALPDGRVLLVIADVCGKGLQGALVGSSLHTLIHSVDEGRDVLSAIVARMNRYLCRFLPEESFVTLLALLVDPRNGHLDCINAGHLPALLARRDGRVRSLQSGRNIPLGVMQAEFELQHTDFGSDELLVMFTDGFTELRDPAHRLLGIDRFRDGVADIVARASEGPMKELETELRRMIDEHRKARLATDDAAFLIARRSEIADRGEGIVRAPWSKCPSATRIQATG